nr:uncharacterized protein LOC117281746 isoform X1 [Nicotiana tomentosiformis]
MGKQTKGKAINNTSCNQTIGAAASLGVPTNISPITHLTQSATSGPQTAGKRNKPEGKTNTGTQYDMAGTSETPFSSMKPTEEVGKDNDPTPMKLVQIPKLAVSPVQQTPNSQESMPNQQEPDPIPQENAEENDQSQNWAGLFPRNRVAANGMALNFIPPQVINVKPTIVLEEKEIKEQTEMWNNTLVIYTMGVSSYNAYLG